MATADQARIQVSEDIGDDFRSTTTSLASDTTTIVDTVLGNYDDDQFVNKFDTWAKVTDGVESGKSRRITTKSGANATVAVAFGAAVASGVSYEVHRLFTPDEKDNAVTHALNLLSGPILFKKAQDEITIVANQFDYTIPAGFYKDQLRQIHLVSTGDTEVTREIFDWELRINSGGAIDIHFHSRLQASQTVRVFGHKVVALSDLTDGDGEFLILTARAVMYLLENGISKAPAEQVERFQKMLERATNTYAERLLRFAPMGIPFTQRTKVFRSGQTDRDFSVP